MEDSLNTVYEFVIAIIIIIIGVDKYLASLKLDSNSPH